MKRKIRSTYKKVYVILIGIAILVGIVIMAVNSIKNLFAKPKLITYEDIKPYLVEEKLVKDYRRFYALDAVAGEVINEMAYINDNIKLNNSVDLSKIKYILNDNYKKAYNDEQLSKYITKFINENYTPKNENQYLITEGILKRAYYFGTQYILEFENFDGEPIYLIVRLANADRRYYISFVE